MADDCVDVGQVGGLGAALVQLAGELLWIKTLLIRNAGWIVKWPNHDRIGMGKRLDELGSYVNPTTPEGLADFIREQQQIWRPIIAETAKTIK